MSKTPNEWSGLSSSDSDFLGKIEEALPTLADLCHADLLLYVAGNQPNTAIVRAQATPHTVSSVLDMLLIGKQVGKKNEPLVFHALRRGTQAQAFRSIPSCEVRTLQRVLPVKGDNGNVIAILSLETNVIEHDRLKRKSQVLKSALSVILRMATEGQLCGAGAFTPIGEHDGLMVVDGAGQILYASRIAENLYRRRGHPGELLGSHYSTVAIDESIVLEAISRGQCIEREVSEQNRVWRKRVIPLQGDESTPWLPMQAGDQSPYRGAFVIVSDITEQRQKEQALKIKSAMIQEIHHRVKNNLQTIAALLRLQARRTRTPEVETMLYSSINRILSIAVVHEFLSHDQDSVINLREICQRILDEVTHGILDPDKDIALRLEGTNLYLSAQQATSCALIVNELLQNAVKHGYVGRTTGSVVARLSDQGDELVIEIADDGTGFTGSVDCGENSHLGLQIIHTLVKEDLKGRFELLNGQGVTARVTFPRLSAYPKEVEGMTDKLEEEESWQRQS